jgi:hypothetical protein
VEDQSSVGAGQQPEGGDCRERNPALQVEMRRASAGRRWLGRLAAVFVGTALALAVFELGAWMTGSYPPEPPLYPGDRETLRDESFDEVLGWKLPPNREITETKEEYSVTYRANRQGFRSPYDFEEQFSGPRIAFVGDSFTFGSGVEYEETFVARLEADLPGTRTLNYGIGGFGIDQMWLTLRDRVIPYGADLVVLVFIRNDLERTQTSIRMGHGWLEKPTFKLHKGELVRVTAEDKPAYPLWWLQQHSRLAERIRRTRNSLGRSQRWIGTWRLNRALIQAMNDDCRRAGIPFAVVHLPVNRRHPMPVLEPEMAEQALYYPLDHHFTAEGHEVASRRLYLFLKREGLVAVRVPE